ncbi:MAG: DNA polymerase domain-containing protein [Leptospirillum sp.]|jgi:DNA polymerase-2
MIHDIPNDTGYLFDVTEELETIGVWVVPSGKKEILYFPDDTFKPSIIARGSSKQRQEFLKTLAPIASSIEIEDSLWHDLETGKDVSCMEIIFLHLNAFRWFQRSAGQYRNSTISLYNIDIDILQRYFYTKNLYPLCPIEIHKKISGPGYLIHRGDSQRLPLEDLSALNILSMKISADTLILCDEHEERILEERGSALKSYLERIFKIHNPDILMTTGGDNALFPLFKRIGMQPPHRKTTLPIKKGLSAENKPHLHGRWHLDTKTSFFLKESGLPGLLEVSRFAQTDLQCLARSTPGKAISSAQLAHAFQRKILIPWKRQSAEHFSRAEDLLKKDRGGMVFIPRSGVHNQIAEIDFSSMYPSLMVEKNISPETINTKCCTGTPVPNSPHRICCCRKGFIPEVLLPILKKRLYLKNLKNQTFDHQDRENLDSRQKALKWILVVCFGYLGYHNARFGSVEAHECVTAWGRETLLVARDLVEDSGYKVIHGIVDALWFGPVASDHKTQLDHLFTAIERKTGVTILMEGIYDWIAFPRGSVDPERASATKYFGKFSDGRIKCRGILSRQSSTPAFIRDVQEGLLEKMGQYHSTSEIIEALPSLLAESLEKKSDLNDRLVPLKDLLVHIRLSKKLSDYKKMTDFVKAAQKKGSDGTAGTRIQYWLAGRHSGYLGDHVVAEGSHEVATIDVLEYQRLLEKAVLEVLDPFINYPPLS